MTHGGLPLISDVEHQFDDEPGGGFGDKTVSAALDGAGATEDLLYGVGDITGGLVGETGEFVGDGLVGAFSTGADALDEAGEGVGSFWSGALNTSTLLLLVVGVAALYLISNSDAAEAGAEAAVASKTGGMG